MALQTAAPSETSATFETTAQVRFAHVDPAGIVFYPRYFEMLNGAVEDWFDQAIGVDFASMHAARGMGVPTVQLAAEFLAPSKLGEVLTIAITPHNVGKSSCTYESVFAVGGSVRLRVSGTLVCMDLETHKAMPWPDDIRAGLMRERAPAE